MPPPKKKPKIHHDLIHKPRQGELVEEDDGIFVSFRTNEGNVQSEYDTSRIRTAKAAERVVPTTVLPETPKIKVNNTIVSKHRLAFRII